MNCNSYISNQAKTNKKTNILYIYIYIYMYVYMYIYIYIYKQLFLTIQLLSFSLRNTYHTIHIEVFIWNMLS